MLLTTLYLDEDTAFMRRRLAETQHRSQAEIIRDPQWKFLNILNAKNDRRA